MQPLSERQAPNRPNPPSAPAIRSARALALISELQLSPHPEGGWYREVFRSAATVQPADRRGQRSALTSIDFLLEAGQFSAWHRVQSDEVWHLLEGESLTLWVLPDIADLAQFQANASMRPQAVVLSASTTRRHVVPAGWWQAAEPGADFAYVGATVAPGFEFSDFAFGRDNPALCQALARQAADLQRLL